MQIDELENKKIVKSVLRALDAYSKILKPCDDKENCEKIFNIIIQKMNFENEDKEWKFIREIFYNENC